MSSEKRYQLPFLGGILVGVGFGLWLFPVVMRSTFFESYGMVGVAFLGVAVIVVGTALGLPTRPSPSGKSRSKVVDPADAPKDAGRGQES